MYTVNWQVIYINEIPRSLVDEFIAMLEQFAEAISGGKVNPHLKSAEKLVGIVLADLKRYGQV